MCDLALHESLPALESLSMETAVFNSDFSKWFHLTRMELRTVVQPIILPCNLQILSMSGLPKTQQFVSSIHTLALRSDFKFQIPSSVTHLILQKPLYSIFFAAIESIRKLTFRLAKGSYELDWFSSIYSYIPSIIEIDFSMDVEDKYYKMYKQKFSKVTLS
jgi:hypothetical protein